jgi:hypothetical protein
MDCIHLKYLLALPFVNRGTCLLLHVAGTERSLLTRLPHNLSLVKTIASQPRKQTLTSTSVQQPFPTPRQFSLPLLSHSILNFWKAPPSHERQHALRNSPRSLKIPLPASTTPNSTHPRPTRGSLYPTI